jgi:hypothetical protein
MDPLPSTNCTTSGDPRISDEGKVVRRSIQTIQQAGDVIKRLIQENRERNTKNARIMAAYNAEQPVSPALLRSEGLSWKSNFSTKPLPVLIDKASSRFPKSIHSARYLTSASLPDSYPDARIKTEKFRRVFTETVRANPLWKNFVAELAQENTMFGYAAAMWLDEEGWMPSFFRQDAFFIPVGTKQSAASCPLIVLVKDNPIHEAAEKLEEASSAEDKRWDLPNLVNAINSAMPEQLRSQSSDYLRVYEDLIRGVSLGTSYTGAEVVRFYHLLATEPTGRVTHIICDRDYRLLFYHPERFAKMTHASAFLSHQQADGTMHGSKGLGREVYNIARALDRSRNEVIDRLQLAGKLVIQCDPRKLNQFRMHVHGNAIMIEEGFEVLERKIDPAVEPFFTLDTYLTGLLDQIGGSTSPKQLSGDRVTAAQVDFMAGREDERADTFQERWLFQFMDIDTEIQRRLCLPDSRDKDAIEFRRKLIEEERFSDREVDYFGTVPAIGVVRELTEVERQNIITVCTAARGNPQYNAHEVEKQYVTALLDADTAEQMLLPQDDPTETAEQSRLQMMENSLLTDGQMIPVSARDNHLVHLEVLAPALQPVAEEAMKSPQAEPILEAYVTHMAAHVNTAKQQGAAPEQLAPYEAAVKQAAAALQQLKQLAAQQPPAQQPPADPQAALAAPAPAG